MKARCNGGHEFSKEALNGPDGRVSLKLVCKREFTASAIVPDRFAAMCRRFRPRDSRSHCNENACLMKWSHGDRDGDVRHCRKAMAHGSWPMGHICGGGMSCDDGGATRLWLVYTRLMESRSCTGHYNLIACGSVARSGSEYVRFDPISGMRRSPPGVLGPTPRHHQSPKDIEGTNRWGDGQSMARMDEECG
jgi:hypothetical protein